MQVELGDYMELLYAVLFIVIIIGAIAILYIYQYNKLQHSKTKIDQAEYLIDESLRGKYDLLLEADNFTMRELKKDKSFFKGLDKLKKENISNFELQAAKSFYNKYTSELNDLIRKFPSNIVARMHGMEIKTFFDGKNMQDEIFDDFKL